mgnify:CR=1 FL=1
MNFRKKESVLGASIAVAILIAGLGISQNYGHLKINSDSQGYTATIGVTDYKCPNSGAECLLKLVPKNYSVKIQQPGFLDFDTKVEVSRWKTAELKYNPIKVVKFAESDVKFSNTVTINSQNIYVGSNLITKFPSGISSGSVASILADNSFATLFDPSSPAQFYLIDVQSKSKKQTNLKLDFTPTNLSILTSKKLLVANTNSIYLFDLKTQNLLQLPITDINHIACDVDQNCYFVSPYDVDKTVDQVDSNLNLFDNMFFEQGTELFTANDQKYFLYKYNLVTGEITNIQRLPAYLNSPTRLFSAKNSEDLASEFYIQSQNSRVFKIIF